MKRIAVYCGFNEGARQLFREAAEETGRLLAERGIELVYGGGSRGLMGAVAQKVLDSGGKVIGVYPHWLEKDVQPPLNGNPDKIEHRVVENMHERKATMAELADGFIALPGGYGTLDEVFEILSWRQLRLHNKPIGFLNVDGYYSPLLGQLDRAVQEDLLKSTNRDLALQDTDIARLLDTFEAHESVDVDAWAIENRT